MNKRYRFMYKDKSIYVFCSTGNFMEENIKQFVFPYDKDPRVLVKHLDAALCELSIDNDTIST